MEKESRQNGSFGKNGERWRSGVDGRKVRAGQQGGGGRRRTMPQRNERRKSHNTEHITDNDNPVNIHIPAMNSTECICIVCVPICRRLEKHARAREMQLDVAERIRGEKFDDSMLWLSVCVCACVWSMPSTLTGRIAYTDFCWCFFLLLYSAVYRRLSSERDYRCDRFEMTLK